MTCATTRDRLLGCERPDQPGPDLSRHLAGCDDCQRWLRRLVRLERRIARRPIDVPPVPAALFDALEPAAPLVRLHAQAPGGRAAAGRRKAALASSLAAALLLFAAGWWAWPNLHDGPPSLAAYHARRDARLAKADGGLRRIGVLVELAGEFVADARRCTPDEADRLATYFEHVCRIDLPACAPGVTPADRAAALDQLARLGKLESEAARLAAEARSARLARAYERMAGSARFADQRLRLMLRA
ncbi:MAG: hypothetical protein ACRC33_25775 [Gemmataceae bacterium]